MSRRVITIQLPVAGQIRVETRGEHCDVALRNREHDTWVPIELCGGHYLQENAGPAKITADWNLGTWFTLALIGIVLAFGIVWRLTS